MLPTVSTKCVPISETTVCSPYESLSIDTTRLARLYRVDPQELTPQIWETKLRTAISGNNLQKIWSRRLECPAYQGEPIQYATSYKCLVDLFVHSAKCNQRSSVPPICPEVCEQYGVAVSTLVNNPEVCPSVENPQVLRRRTQLAESATRCAALLNRPNFEGTCIAGVRSDQESCGN
jgi:hypothetical protein